MAAGYLAESISSTVEGGAWSVRVDIEACPELELVLPARREAVETEFLNEMRQAARLAIYRAMAAADPAPRIAFKDHKSAAEAGIALPVPPAELRPWRPGIADIDDWRDTPAFAPVDTRTLVMAVDPDRIPPPKPRTSQPSCSTPSARPPACSQRAPARSAPSPG